MDARLRNRIAKALDESVHFKAPSILELRNVLATALDLNKRVSKQKLQYLENVIEADRIMDSMKF